MTTLSDFVELCQANLSDATGTTFTDDLVQGWIEEAIQEYSQHFGKVVEITVSSIAAGTYKYAVTDPISGIVQVEYPLSQNPPQYLTRRVYASDDFWLHADSYDFIPTKGSAAGNLYLSDPSQGTSAKITANQVFDEDAATMEVPLEHEPLLMARVRWSARQFMADGEMLNPTSSSSLLMAQMEQNAKSARANYFKFLYTALLAESGKSEVIRWEMDQFDRIY
jgi:hypothetical protein